MTSAEITDRMRVLIDAAEAFRNGRLNRSEYRAVIRCHQLDFPDGDGIALPTRPSAL